jgi:predicted membrane protein
MMSGATWTITPEDALITLAILLLFVEIFKATRGSSSRSIVDHMLSMFLFIIMLVEFLLVAQAATSTFFLLMMITFVDVIGGFTITARAARRDIAVEESLVPADRA